MQKNKLSLLVGIALALNMIIIPVKGATIRAIRNNISTVKFEVTQFSVKIGKSVFSLEYANDEADLQIKDKCYIININEYYVN